MSTILIGADPELFVTRDGEMVPAVGMVPGTKANPHPVNGGTVQVDGLALEIGIKPAEDERRFSRRIVDVMNQMLHMLPENTAFSEASSATFAARYWDNLTEDDKQLGCEPDFNAYTLAENPPPENLEKFRVAGGHVHVGWTRDADIEDPAHFQACARVARNMDLYLGVPSILEDQSGAARRIMYGAAGAFRPKPYGLEYRSLSNYWIFSSVLREAVFKRAHTTIHNLLTYKLDLCETIGQYNGMPMGQHIINNFDTAKAYEFVHNNQIGVYNNA